MHQYIHLNTHIRYTKTHTHVRTHIHTKTHMHEYIYCPFFLCDIQIKFIFNKFEPLKSCAQTFKIASINDFILYISNSNNNNNNNNNAIRHRMCQSHNEKWKKINKGRNRTAKSRKNQNARRKGKLQVLGNIRRRYHQTNRDERKNKKRLPQKNKKTSRNKTLQLRKKTTAEPSPT